MAYFEFILIQTLNHYTSAAAFDGIAWSKELWLSNLIKSNDPRELKFGYAHLASVVSQIRERSDIKNASRISPTFSCAGSTVIPSTGSMNSCHGHGKREILSRADISAAPGRIRRPRGTKRDPVTSLRYYDTAAESDLWAPNAAGCSSIRSGNARSE